MHVRGQWSTCVHEAARTSMHTFKSSHACMHIPTFTKLHCTALIAVHYNSLYANVRSCIYDDFCLGKYIPCMYVCIYVRMCETPV